MGGSVVRSAGSCGGSQIHCTLSKEGEGNVQCIAFEGLGSQKGYQTSCHAEKAWQREVQDRKTFAHPSQNSLDVHKPAGAERE